MQPSQLPPNAVHRAVLPAERSCYSLPMAINLKTVIAELQFILELSNDNPKDERLPPLVAAAQKDLATAAQAISGDDPGIGN